MPTFFETYLTEVAGYSTDAVLHKALEALNGKLEEKLNAIGDVVYAEGKWPVPVILQHLIDTKRIMAYRALRFARKDKTPLSPFDEETYADAMLNSQRSVETLLEELKIVRVSNIYMFDSFDDETLMQTGIANNKEISVGALAYVIAGHQMHHLRIIDERYLPLAKGIISPF